MYKINGCAVKHTLNVLVRLPLKEYYAKRNFIMFPPFFLNMQAMSQSLNFGKSVSDNGWGMFTVFLKYKLEELGKKLIQIDKFFASSQICSACGYKNSETKDLSVREWICPCCQTHHNRDINAAVNIRNEGMRIALA